MERNRDLARRRWTSRAVVAVLAVLMSAGVSAGAGVAAVQQPIPDEQAGPPYYARLENDVIRTDEWVAIPFYRDPACVPADFNLLQFFDIPGAFSCPLTVDGLVIWENGPPPQDQAPIHQSLHGTGDVPVWFVSWTDMEPAMSDGVLTIVELAALPSLQVGSADYFHETLHPTGGAQRGKIQLTASGVLDDGRSFRLHVSATEGSRAVGSEHLSIELG